MEEIVYKEEVGTKGLICQFIKTETGYLRQQIFPTGLIIEGDYTEEEYQKFLHDVQTFKNLQQQSVLSKKKSKRR